MFNVPFQHKYGYIRDERSGVESYPYKPTFSDVKLTLLYKRLTNVISTLRECFHANVESTLNQSAKLCSFNVHMQTLLQPYRKRYINLINES